MLDERAVAASTSARRLALAHCVLTHHGDRRARGASPAEALALHRLNALDAGVKGAIEHGMQPGA